MKRLGLAPAAITHRLEIVCTTSDCMQRMQLKWLHHLAGIVYGELNQLIEYAITDKLFSNGHIAIITDISTGEILQPPQWYSHIDNEIWDNRINYKNTTPIRVKEWKDE